MNYSIVICKWCSTGIYDDRLCYDRFEKKKESDSHRASTRWFLVSCRSLYVTQHKLARHIDLMSDSIQFDTYLKQIKTNGKN